MTHQGERQVQDSAGGAPLPTVTKLGFAAGDFGFNLLWTGTSLFLLCFYTDVLGLSPTAAGLVYFVAMAWDAISDPIMGVIADRTRSRWGRYGPYILFGSVPLALSLPLAYSNPGFAGTALFAWTLFTHCILRTAYTVASIPYTSLRSRLTEDSDARVILAGWRMIGAALGGLTVAFATPALVKALGAGDEGQGYFLASAVLGAASIGIFVFCYSALREPPEQPGAQETSSILRDAGAFVMLFRSNGPLVQIFLVIVVISIAITMFSKNVLYYLKYDLVRPEIAPGVLVMPAIAMLLFVPVWVSVAKATSKRTAWMMGGSIALAGYLAFYLNTSHDLSVILVLIGLIALGGSAFAVLFWSMLPDTVEYGEAESGVRHEAKTFGFASFAQKSALGVNALLVGILLDATYYVANQPQSPETLPGIKSIMSLVPAAGVLVTMIILWRYPIDARFLRELRRRIAASAPSLKTSSGDRD